MGLKMGSVDHQNASGVILRFGQLLEDTLEHAVFGPPPEPVIERLVWPVISGCINLLQPVLDDIDNPAQNLAVISAVNPT